MLEILLVAAWAVGCGLYRGPAMVWLSKSVPRRRQRTFGKTVHHLPEGEGGPYGP